MSVLSFSHIEKSYGDVRAVRDVSFEVLPGEVLGLLGPNGAGKTTLIRILMDIIRADAGTVTLFGQPHTGNLLNRVGYLPEERGLYKKQKVVDMLTYFGQLKGLSHAVARQRSFTWLEKVGLPETANWQIERLSKGMSQKVQIAGTLLYEPELCVLDEPFSGLDPVNVRLVQDLMFERRRAGKTTILSTHQMNLVETLCDRVALINKGQLMVYGPVQKVREDWSLPEVSVRLEGEPPPLACLASTQHEHNGTWRLLLKDGTSPAQALAQLVGAGAQIESFEKVLTPMEEVFVRVVEGVKA